MAPDNSLGSGLVLKLIGDGADLSARVKAGIMDVAETAELGSPELADLVAEGFAAGDRVPVSADFDGMHYSFVVWWVSRGHVFKADLHIEPVRWW